MLNNGVGSDFTVQTIYLWVLLVFISSIRQYIIDMIVLQEKSNGSDAAIQLENKQCVIKNTARD